MDPQDKYVRIANGLFRKTAEDKLEWSRTSAEDEYQCVLSEHVVRITKFSDERDFTYIVSIFNEDGEVIDQFDDEELDLHERGQIGDQYFEMLKALHMMIRRRVMGIDSAIDSILEDLEDE